MESTNQKRTKDASTIILMVTSSNETTIEDLQRLEIVVFVSLFLFNRNANRE